MQCKSFTKYWRIEFVGKQPIIIRFNDDRTNFIIERIQWYNRDEEKKITKFATMEDHNYTILKDEDAFTGMFDTGTEMVKFNLEYVDEWIKHQPKWD